MKEVARIKDYNIKEFWFKYYVFWKDDNGQEFDCGWFETLKDALDYVASWVK